MLHQHFSSRQPSIIDMDDEQNIASVSLSSRLQDVEGELLEDDDINIGENTPDPEEEGNSDTRVGKESRHSTSELDVINRNVLKKYFGMKLIDAAMILNVSKSTIKRKCRKYGITSWLGHERATRVLRLPLLAINPSKILKNVMQNMVSSRAHLLVCLRLVES
ncbi:hypothetical protein ACH5RR_025085 [Cinchona calisaya]|uniref:RWP-RK domain-containing protein n=1 Tax=Cinchona calisaya TaxID=153742 RepID=A0ABD2YYL6_9GENT